MNPSNSTQTPNTPFAAKPRYIMIGGFLGAGKTTAIGKLARRLTDLGHRVGLITNDQGRHLVDTTMLRSQGFSTEEIPGGCFCCRFNSLVEASQKLTATVRPDVLIAEPVGSCTDLAATVTYPLRRYYSETYTVAPVSALVDPIRALRVFGLEDGGSFSEKVLYIYLKQLEEADLVVISKCDLVEARRLEALKQSIAEKFPGKEVLAVSARAGTNLDDWFARITGLEQVAQRAMDVDYEVYADGEALLGWLNCTVQLSATRAFDANSFLSRLALEIQRGLLAQAVEVAHLKMTLSPEGQDTRAIAAVSLVRNDFTPEMSFQLPDLVTAAELAINLRAEAAPDILGTAMREGLSTAAGATPSLRATLDHLEHFRPGKPTPTHRFAALTA